MALEAYYGHSLQPDTSSPAIEFLLAKWRTLKDTNAITIQRLTEESSYPIRANSLYMLKTENDFVYMYQGETIRKIFGRDLAGTLLSDIGDIVAVDLASIYKRVVEDDVPCFVRFSSAVSQKNLIFQRLVLPVKVGNEAIVLVCYTEVMPNQYEVLEFLFQEAPKPQVIVFPAYDEVGRINDGWIVMMNNAARQFFDYQGPLGYLRLRELAFFNSDVFWDRFNVAQRMPTLHKVLRHDARAVEFVPYKHLISLKID